MNTTYNTSYSLPQSKDSKHTHGNGQKNLHEHLNTCLTVLTSDLNKKCSGEKNAIRTMHLFAGHGGGLLADLILGHTPIVAVEWDKYACQVLRERAADGWFPDLSVWEGDVRLFDPSPYKGKVDCIHAGFPCQDISVAGKQAGVGPETRSGLYREVLRIAGVVRPKQLFLENVSAIVNNGLGTVLADLAALGYDTEWLCLRASDCGANHHRDRWWLLANANELGAAAGAQGKAWDSLPDGDRNHTQEERGRDELDAWTGGICEVLADTPSQCSNGGNDNARVGVESQSIPESGDSGWSTNVAHADSAQRQGNQCTKRIGTEYSDFGSAGWWEAESWIRRVANGVPHRVHRLKGLGNAQVPLQAAVAYRLLGGI